MKFRSYIKFIIPLLLVGVLAFLYGFASARNLNKKVEKIAVEFDGGENHFLTHSVVNKLLIQNKETVKNLPKRMIDLHFLEGRVLSNPYVEKATVFLTPNGLLKTIIKQREPIARIINKQGSYYVDRYGIKVPLSANFTAHVPMVLGIESSKDIKELTALVTLITKDDFLKKEVVGIQKSAENEYTFNVRSGDYKIKFGKFTNVDVKFKKLKAFYNKAFFDKTIQNYKTINVKYHNQVVCTK